MIALMDGIKTRLSATKLAHLNPSLPSHPQEDLVGASYVSPFGRLEFISKKHGSVRSFLGGCQSLRPCAAQLVKKEESA